MIFQDENLSVLIFHLHLKEIWGLAIDSLRGPARIDGQPGDKCGFCVSFLLWSGSLVGLAYNEPQLRAEFKGRELAQGT